eukprot:855557-Pyramimonas_sp.AAC.1
MPDCNLLRFGDLDTCLTAIRCDVVTCGLLLAERGGLVGTGRYRKLRGAKACGRHSGSLGLRR